MKHLAYRQVVFLLRAWAQQREIPGLKLCALSREKLLVPWRWAGRRRGAWRPHWNESYIKGMCISPDLHWWSAVYRRLKQVWHTVLCMRFFKESISTRTRDIWYMYGAAHWGFACTREMRPARADIGERQNPPEDWELCLPCTSHTMTWYTPTALKWQGQLNCLREYPLQPQTKAMASLLCPRHIPLPLLVQQGQ